MSNLIPFQFDGKDIRIEMDHNDQPWWLLDDCCIVLEIEDIHRAASRIDIKYRRKTPVLARD